ncbi:MAG: DUF3575 domain-containing protein [Rikenellaceae bacterium]
MIPDSLIEKNHSGIDWNGLQALVAESDVQYKEEVSQILTTIPEETWQRVSPDDRWLSLVDSRSKHLMDLMGGNTYRYMFDNFYPLLRRGSVVTLYFKSVAPAIVEEEVVEIAIAEEPKEEVAPTPTPVVDNTPAEPEIVDKPMFAVKTNLLFDVATLVNIELEIPIKERWSVAGEWIFPWWTSSDKESSGRNCLQLLNGNIEGKYWFGDRTDRPVMTGWHVGLYAGGGLYDLELNKEGYQGEFFIAAGLSGGYAHTINRCGSLRMEYSAGIGYMKTNYDHYTEHWGIDNSWHTLRENRGYYSWFGPTRVRVSFVWMLNRKVNKER